MQHKERDMFLRLGNGAQDAFRQERTHTVHEQHRIVEEEEEARINFVLNHMESEQRAPLSILESVAQKRDLVRQAQNLRDIYHRSEQSA